MKLFASPAKNALYFSYRLMRPVFDPLHFATGLSGYGWFFRDMIAFKRKDVNARIFGTDLFPIMDDKTSRTPFDSHYFYQQVWAFGKILKARPTRHVDIGSAYLFSGYVSTICKTEFVDIRPIDSHRKNLKVVRGDILDLPYPAGSIRSLSSLHVLEHIGLGRYGDAVDPRGTRKACREIVRVLAPGGRAYISVPIGRSRICFNAHRIFEPRIILSYFGGLKLLDFSVVDDDGTYYAHVNPKSYDHLNYGCGFFAFRKL